MLHGALDVPNLFVDEAHLSCSRLDLLASLTSTSIIMVEAHVNGPDIHHESLCKAMDVFSREIKIDLDDRSICATHEWA